MYRHYPPASGWGLADGGKQPIPQIDLVVDHQKRAMFVISRCGVPLCNTTFEQAGTISGVPSFQGRAAAPDDAPDVELPSLVMRRIVYGPDETHMVSAGAMCAPLNLC